jgi:hypothetical protein
LGAGTYYIFVVGEDGKNVSFPTFFAVPGTTEISNEVSATVGASGKISLTFTLPTAANSYQNVRLYWGTAGTGSENCYIETHTPSGGLFVLGVWSYDFTSTSSCIAGSAADAKADAAQTYLWDNLTCVACNGPFREDGTTSINTFAPVVIGTHAWDGASKVDILGGVRVTGGVLDAEGGIKSVLVTKSSAYTVSTKDYWVNVTGTTTITVPHAGLGNHWVVFNSGSNTVTVQADSGNINGAASITLPTNTGKEVTCDGTNCFAH